MPLNDHYSFYSSVYVSFMLSSKILLLFELSFFKMNLLVTLLGSRHSKSLMKGDMFFQLCVQTAEKLLGRRKIEAPAEHTGISSSYVTTPGKCMFCWPTYIVLCHGLCYTTVSKLTDFTEVKDQFFSLYLSIYIHPLNYLGIHFTYRDTGDPHFWMAI